MGHLRPYSDNDVSEIKLGPDTLWLWRWKTKILTKYYLLSVFRSHWKQVAKTKAASFRSKRRQSITRHNRKMKPMHAYRESKPQLITIFSRKWIMTTLFSRSRHDVFSALFSQNTGAYKKIFVPIYAVTKAENLWNFWTMMNQTLISVEIPQDDNEFSQW